MADWARRLQQGRFLVLGRVGMDMYAEPAGTPLDQADRFMATIGGSAGNIAVALARQGVPAALISRVSDDAVGRFCLARLAGFGVDTAHVGRAGPAARSSLAVTETRDPECQVVLYRNGAADMELTVADVMAADFTAAAALVVTGTALAAEPSRSATLQALAQARGAGAVTVLDVDYRAASWSGADQAQAVGLRVAEQCDIVIGNDQEWDLLAGSPTRGAALARSLAHSGAAFTVYKRGPEGSVTYLPDHSFRTGIFPVTAQKPMGAGDGFMGGLLAGLSRGLPLPQAVARGAATAAMIVAGVGCAPASPDTAALEAFIARHAPQP